MFGVIIAPYVNTLFVGDGIFRFGPADPTEATFTVEFLRNTLRSTRGHGPGFKVTCAHRGEDPAADIPHFKFTTETLAPFDVVWLFGYDGANFEQSNDGESIDDDEVLALTAFMNRGGGVMAVGDHDGLGSVMCGRVPRVRSMRKWFAEHNPPAGFPPNAPGLGTNRLDTTRPDHSNQFWFDNQSDDIPQEFTVVHPHPVLQSPAGLITRFPDHMHEGEVTVPWKGLANPVIKGQEIDEYPTVWHLGEKFGFRVHEKPVVIATGTTIAGHPTPLEGQDSKEFTGDWQNEIGRSFDAICVYDGSRVGVGRVLTQSSFHHFIDLNLTGDTLGVGDKRLGFQTAGGQATLEGLQRYFRNVGFWLAEHTHWYIRLIDYVVQLPWWVKLFNPGGPVEENPEPILQYGLLMRQALARYMSDDATVDFVRAQLEPHGLVGWLPERPWQGLAGRGVPQGYGRIVEAALGGAAMALMAARGRDRREVDVRPVALEGMIKGLRGLSGLMERDARRDVERAERLRAALVTGPAREGAAAP